MSEVQKRAEAEVQCSVCGLVFTPEWSDEEAAAEFAQNFACMAIEESEVVCEDCYQKLKPRYPS